MKLEFHPEVSGRYGVVSLFLTFVGSTSQSTFTTYRVSSKSDFNRI